ncbi:MAG: hypothetical protein GY797_01425 [Deltaproteobacteria bacterium]|nr:hypothetical protein [Deltaproteobacteria bacterium]
MHIFASIPPHFSVSQLVHSLTGKTLVSIYL